MPLSLGGPEGFLGRTQGQDAIVNQAQVLTRPGVCRSPDVASSPQNCENYISVVGKHPAVAPSYSTALPRQRPAEPGGATRDGGGAGEEVRPWGQVTDAEPRSPGK